jgi:hypothetical protein
VDFVSSVRDRKQENGKLYFRRISCFKLMLSTFKRLHAHFYLHTIPNKILHTIRSRKANWNGQVVRRDCLLKRVIQGKIEGRIEVTGRRGRRRK